MRAMLLVAGLAFCLAFAGLLVLLSAPGRRLALDHPNPRSLHVTPVPRTGGLAILAGTAAALAFASGSDFRLVLIALALAAVSFGDDLFGLPALWRLAAHLAAAALALWMIVPRPEPVLFIPLLLGIAWLTNLFNFMDGSDGLAAGMAVAGFGTFAFAAHLHGAPALALPCLSLASASLAFLLFNFHPAKIFMGDAGSIPLGFLAGALGVAGWRSGVWPLWFPVLVFSPFVVDATLTLARRLLRREKVWQAHREHYYQRALQAGLGHRGTALFAYALMAGCAAAALHARTAPPAVQAATLVLATLAYAVLARYIDRRWSRRRPEEAH